MKTIGFFNINIRIDPIKESVLILPSLLLTIINTDSVVGSIHVDAEKVREDDSSRHSTQHDRADTTCGSKS